MREKFRSNAVGMMVAVAAATGMLSTTVHAVDVDAGDYTTLPAGTNLGVMYYQHAERNALYAQDRRVPIDARLDSDIGILRGVHFTEIAGVIVDPQFLLPFGRLHGKGDLDALGSNSGVGDLILAVGVFGTRPQARSHFAVMPYLWLPTGQYSRHDPLSLGENRWKFALQAGYITPVSEKVTLDLIGDVTVFGKNGDADDGTGGRTTLKQRPLFDLQVHTRYHVGPATDLRFQIAHSFGGETKLGDVRQDNRISTTRAKLGFSHFIGPKTQLLATYNRDLDVKEGFKINNGIQLRLLHLY
jgi:hypothetical protein